MFIMCGALPPVALFLSEVILLGGRLLLKPMPILFLIKNCATFLIYVCCGYILVVVVLKYRSFVLYIDGLSTVRLS